jgi:hypothetical protein
MINGELHKHGRNKTNETAKGQKRKLEISYSVTLCSLEGCARPTNQFRRHQAVELLYALPSGRWVIIVVKRRSRLHFHSSIRMHHRVYIDEILQRRFQTVHRFLHSCHLISQRGGRRTCITMDFIDRIICRSSRCSSGSL